MSAGDRGRSSPAGEEEVAIDDLEIEGLDEKPRQAVRPTSPPPRRSSQSPPRPLEPVARFGVYDILGRLAVGGMAEILLAREDLKGLGPRYLVVKRVLPDIAEDPEYIEMFLQEARVTMQLRHPAICHIYGFGDHEGAPYIAMEWVHGVSLGKLIRGAKQIGGIPPWIVARIIADVAGALEHAHGARDSSGTDLGLVHRDVTPQNIMISYDGDVKLLDFGIAKSAGAHQRTRAGVVKGKFAYMAPEQARGDSLDARTDIFGLGVCMWEALTGKSLFMRQTEVDTLRAVLECKVPPARRYRAETPEDLEAIAGAATTPDRDGRFSTAGAMKRDLEHAIARAGEVVGAAELAALLRTLFEADMAKGPNIEPRFGSGISGARVPPPDVVPIGESSDASAPAAHPSYQGIPPPNAHPSFQGVPLAQPVPPSVPARGARPTAPSYQGAPVQGMSASGGSLLDHDVGPTGTQVIGDGDVKGLAALVDEIPRSSKRAHASRSELGPSSTSRAAERTSAGPTGVVSRPPPSISSQIGAATGRAPAALARPSPIVHALFGTLPGRIATGVVALLLLAYLAGLGLGYARRSSTADFAQPDTTESPPTPPRTPARSGATGYLTIDARPAALVMAGDRVLGRTPLTRVEVPIGELTVELIGDTGLRKRRTLDIREREEARAFVAMTPE